MKLAFTKINAIKLTTAVAFTCVISGNALADNMREKEKTNEAIGLGSGILVGTAIAGPIGGFVAGLFGVMIADDVNSDNRLLQAQKSLAEKDQQLFVMQQNFEQAKQRATVQIASMDRALEQSKAEIETNIQFKTASYVLEEHYKPQLDLIARTMQHNPKLTITLSGFADKRGDSVFNQALSEQRALTVKNYLIGKSVKEEQVITNSYGESSLVSTGSHFEDDFFDRRVMLKVSDTLENMTASNQPSL